MWPWCVQHFHVVFDYMHLAICSAVCSEVSLHVNGKDHMYTVVYIWSLALYRWYNKNMYLRLAGIFVVASDIIAV